MQESLYQYYTIVVLTVSVSRRRDVIDRCPHVRPQAFILALPRFASLLLLLITSRQFASTDTQGSTRRRPEAARATAIPRGKSAAWLCPSGKPRQAGFW